MTDLLRYFGQAVVYGLIAVLFGYFSSAPSYVHFPPDQAAIKISLVHSAKPKEPCHRLTREELAALPPNMRKPVSCPRERLPVRLEVMLDDRLLLRAELPPGGLAGDGPARIDRRFTVAPGSYRLALGMRDSDRTEGYDYAREIEITLVAQQSLAIDFRAERGGFFIR